MTFFRGGNNPGNVAYVDSAGRIEAHAVSDSEQDYASVIGEAFNINTGLLTLTNAAETPVLYILNESEDKDVKISRLFMTFLSSTLGLGKVKANLYRNVTGGDIVNSGTPIDLSNFNLGSGKTVGIVSKSGATGQSFTAVPTNFEFVYTSDNQRQLTVFDSIILPRGASMLLTFTPPAGNTSIEAEFGVNVFLALSNPNA